jgi:hypothetical protein
MKFVLRVPSNLLACVWLVVAVGSRSDLHSVQITHNIKQVMQQDRYFWLYYLRARLTLT